MASDQEAAYERLLSSNLNRAVDWVKYGDAKNAALLAFASAWLAGIGNLLLSGGEKHLPPVVVFFLFVSELLFLVGALHAIVALSPVTDPHGILARSGRGLRQLFAGDRRQPSRFNLLFFGDIRHLDPDVFKLQISQRYNPKGTRIITDAYVSDLCSQTLINARIAQRKFDVFDRGFGFVSFSLLVLIVPFFIELLRTLYP
jgi:hypothetical protein